MDFPSVPANIIYEFNLITIIFAKQRLIKISFQPDELANINVSFFTDKL